MISRSLALVFVLAAVSCSGDVEAEKRARLQSGDKLFAEGKFVEATLEYRNALKADRNFGEARLRLADAHAELRDPRAALREYVRAADLLPDNTGAQLKAATSLLRAGRFEDANSRIQRVLDKDPNNAEALVIRGSALAGLKDLSGALEQLEEAIRLAPERGLSYANLGLLKMEMGQQDEAKAAFIKAVDVDPKSRSALLALANFYLSTAETSKAEEILQRALALDERDLLTRRAMALLYLTSNRLREAEPHLLAAAALDSSPGPRYALAEYYRITSRPSDARKILEPMATQPETFATAQMRLAQLEYDQGQPAPAHSMVDAVLAKDANNIEALVAKAEWQLREGSAAKAAELAERAVKAAPDVLLTHYVLGLSRDALDDTDAAIASFQEMRRVNPRAILAQVHLARLELARGNARAAEQHAREVLSAQPDAVPARFTLARALIAQRDLQRGEAAVKALLREFPNAAASHALDGSVHLQKKDFGAAAGAFNRALALDPHSTDAFSGLVSTDVMTQRVAEARARVDRRLQQGRPSVALLLVASRVYIQANDVGAAERVLRQAIDLAPANGTATMLLANLYTAQGRLERAQAEFTQLARRDPKNAGHRLMVALIAHTRGRLPEAQEAYEQVLELNPQASLASNNLAWILLDKGDAERAVRLAQKAVSQAPDNADYNDTLGWVYVQRQLPSLAVAPLERAAARSPDNPRIHFHLGRALADVGQTPQARASLQKALGRGLTGADAVSAKNLLLELN